MRRNLIPISHRAPPWLKHAAAFALLLCLAFVVRVGAQEQNLSARADLEQKLGAQIPLDLTFTDETGQTVPLRHYFGERPVVLQMGYNHCWLMCDVVTGALVRSLQDLRLDPGRDFDVVFVSIDPNETWQLAAKKRDAYIRSYGRSKDRPGLAFSHRTKAADRRLGRRGRLPLLL